MKERNAYCVSRCAFHCPFTLTAYKDLVNSFHATPISSKLAFELLRSCRFSSNKWNTEPLTIIRQPKQKTRSPSQSKRPSVVKLIFRDKGCFGTIMLIFKNIGKVLSVWKAGDKLYQTAT